MVSYDASVLKPVRIFFIQKYVQLDLKPMVQVAYLVPMVITRSFQVLMSAINVVMTGSRCQLVPNIHGSVHMVCFNLSFH